jgi:hypothetical protein
MLWCKCAAMKKLHGSDTTVGTGAVPNTRSIRSIRTRCYCNRLMLSCGFVLLASSHELKWKFERVKYYLKTGLGKSA